MHLMSMPILSNAIIDALHESSEISRWISTNHPSSIVQTPTSMLAGPSYGICLEHREAVLLLVEHDCRTSAYALLRPVYEAYMRGLWAEECADESALAQIVRTKELPTMDTVTKQLDKVGGDSNFAQSKAKVWRAMSHYAHGGLRQLERWANADGIGPHHPDGETIEVLHHVNLYGLLALLGIARLAHVPTERLQTLQERVLTFITKLSGAT
jgi:hypothetical protein